MNEASIIMHEEGETGCDWAGNIVRKPHFDVLNANAGEMNHDNKHSKGKKVALIMMVLSRFSL